MTRTRTTARLLDQARDEIHHTAKMPPVTAAVDWGALDRMERFAAERRAELGETRWAELNREWK